MKDLKTSIFITTYNWPEALSLCLQSIMYQSILPDEIIIADDGSGAPTLKVVEDFKKISPVPIVHIWIEDSGYQINKIRNLAIEAATHPFIIQIDGDVILDKHFIHDHLKIARANRLNIGRRVRLSMDKTKELCQTGQIRGLHYLRSLALCRIHHSLFYSNKTVRGLRGCNVAFWKKDALAVNGYDESMQGKGKNDKEFGARLINLGVKGYNIRNYAICYHLEHLETKAYGAENIQIFQETIDKNKTVIAKGIRKY
ncbi:MAG: glycosyltransferase [Cyclobacteriaceae bacterium]|nr:glycosyltransferase [Cyclobacteriaceae bacterium]